MIKIKDQMDKVVVSSYLDCVWYLPHLDKCKLQLKPKQYCDCTCKEKMDGLCIWLTKFLKSTPEEVGSRDIRDDNLLAEYGFLLGDYDPAKKSNMMQDLMNAINEEEVTPFNF